MIIYLDTETTGLYPGRICQLSYIMEEKEVKAKNFFFSVPSVEYGAYLVHGFSPEKLAVLSNGEKFYDRIDEIEKDFSSADVLVSHNTAFDFMFLRSEFINAGKTFIINDEFCTMKNSVGLCKLKRNSGGYKYPKLNELCEFLGITNTEISKTSKTLFGEEADFHDARFDTTAVYLSAKFGEDYSAFLPLKKYLK